MIKCGVCGSENEAAALFCGTCGSPLNPADAQPVVDEVVEPTVPEPTSADDAVVPGKGGARRDLGTGGDSTIVPDSGVAMGTATEVVIADDDSASGGPTIVCGVCGTVNDATRTYCRKCANELKPAPPPPPPPPPPPAPRRISPVALGLGAAAAVVAIALVGVLVFGGNPGASLAPTAQASASPSAGEPTPEGTLQPTATARTFTEGDPSGLIAFARCPPDGANCTIYVRPADSSENARRLTSTGSDAFDPSLSRDGTRILYSVSGLRIIDIESGDIVRHSNGADDSDGAWSSDDTQIVYAGHRDRDPGDDNDDFEIRLDTITVTQDSIPLTSNDVLDFDPDWLPDDSGIVFAQGEGDASALKLIDIDTREITDLTSPGFGDEDPAVSPDGTEVVFTSLRGETGGYDLFLLNLETLEITALTPMEGDEHDPAWSPGGRYIIFSGGPAGRENLIILDLADGQFETYTATSASDRTPSWR